ncbi:hypothetical protein QQS21_005428 [Conoideocrella luteorostrata]|uniref:Beta-lactamase-related domain-containing protein n=1 Tax=Conoideocrella luteorostrata TaxID=1105319 RepID=A0AAJ0CPR0_9HYPO|nr:hypothetical protein QQS21_005428 [Conoideocrella luteorostrata]
MPTVGAIASITKLMTAVAVMQCVEQRKLNLDDDVRHEFHIMGKYSIIEDSDEEHAGITFKSVQTPITLRMLLTHTSGHEYDWFSALLLEGRAKRNGLPWSGSTVEDKSTLPLLFAPGTGFAYGAGNDWAGKLLDEYMRTHIWTSLGIDNEVTFHPKTKQGMEGRMADLTTLNAHFEPPAVDEPNFDSLFSSHDCFGGGGAYATAQAFYTSLSAVFRRDARLLTPMSYTELFRPQLDEHTEKAMCDYINSTPEYTRYLGLGVPASIRKNCCFAGMVCIDGQDIVFEKGTAMCGGFPSCK